MYKWIKHIIIFLLFVCCNLNTSGQDIIDTNRSFGRNLKTKYRAREFRYTPESEKEEKDNKKIEETIKKADDIDLTWLGKAFVAFLIIFLAIVIIKAFYGSTISIPKNELTPQKDIQLLEEEEINIKQNFNEKINAAIKTQNYRLATRYYYLQTLKKLSDKNIIHFHAEKTNLDYQVEIKNSILKDRFKSLSRLYDYIWYGKFQIDELDFKRIQAQFNDFSKL